jgi:hypothetical protein
VSTATGSRLEHPIGVNGLFAVSLRSGTIRLRGVDGDAVRIRDSHGDDLAAGFAIELGPGTAALRGGRGGGVAGRRSGGGSADLDIDVPRGATVVIDGTSAEIEATGLAGDQRYQSISGDITLHGVSGTISVDAVSGDVDITTTDRTALTARVVSGDIDLRAATLISLEIATTSGDLKVAGRLAGDGPFAIETVSGDALLAPVGDIRVEMKTVAGDLRSEIGGTAGGGPGRRSLVVGDRGPVVSFRSMSGDLRVVRAIAVTAAPVEHAGTPPDPDAGHPSTAVDDTAPGPAPRQDDAAASDAVQGRFERVDTERVPVIFPATALATPAETSEAADEDARIVILRLLEAGQIDVAEAGRRLESLDGPNHTAGEPHHG